MSSMHGNGSKALMVMAVTKAIIAVMLVGSGCYCLVTGTEMTGPMVPVMVAVVGTYFGLSARVYQVDAEYKKRQENSRTRRGKV